MTQPIWRIYTCAPGTAISFHCLLLRLSEKKRLHPILPASNAAEYGAAIAGLSQLAVDLAIDQVVLVLGLAHDGADRLFDGLRRGETMAWPRGSGREAT